MVRRFPCHQHSSRAERQLFPCGKNWDDAPTEKSEAPGLLCYGASLGFRNEGKPFMVLTKEGRSGAGWKIEFKETRITNLRIS